MVTIRKNQSALTAQEWADLIDAINQTHGVNASAPAYRAFVKVHMQAMDMSNPVGMSWHVHTMGMGMPGTNFLAWHRQLVLRLERRLQKVHPSVAIPYWDAVVDRQIPVPLDDPALLKSWSVTRDWNPSILATKADRDTALAMTTFRAFQATLEAAVHSSVHNAVGGDMATAASPSDPLFWLHHANLDRLWATWRSKHPGQDPPNKTEVLKPKPLFGVTVASVLDLTALGYEYA